MFEIQDIICIFTDEIPEKYWIFEAFRQPYNEYKQCLGKKHFWCTLNAGHQGPHVAHVIEDYEFDSERFRKEKYCDHWWDTTCKPTISL